MVRSNLLSPKWLVPIAALGALAVVGSFMIASSIAHEQVHQSDEFWGRVTYRGAQIDACPTADGMLADSDAVVVGHFSDMAPGRVLGDPDDDNAAYYLAGSLVIDEVVYRNPERHGELAEGETIVFETFTFEPGDVEDLANSYPTERFLAFLRNKGVSAERIGLSAEIVAAEAGYYRAMCAEGIVRDLPSGPAAVLPDDDRLADLALATFDDVLDAVRELSASQTSRSE